MAHLVNDDVDRRLRAARPAPIEPDAFDAVLLERLLAQPRPVPRRTHRLAPPLVAVAALAAVAFFLFAGGPGNVGGPATASAIEQALRWFDPPAGSILYARSEGTTTSADGRRETWEREVWQSADDPAKTRIVIRQGSTVIETSDRAIYDARTNTIYKPAGNGKPTADESAKDRNAKATEPAAARKPSVAEWAKRAIARRNDKRPAIRALEGGDPVVSKVRSLLTAGRATVRGREVHDGTEAWAITLPPGAGRPAWTLWVAVADGRPLALHDPGDPANGKAAEDARWTAYDVRPATGADEMLSLAATHPDARVVRDDSRFVEDAEPGRHARASVDLTPLVVDLVLGTHPLQVIVVHMKSNFINRGRELWEDPARRQAFVVEALVNRRRISAEGMRLRRYLDARLSEDPAAAIVVLGDLNDGPGLDYFEELYLTHNVTDILVGSAFRPEWQFTHAQHDVPAARRYTAVFEDFVPTRQVRRLLLDHILLSPGLTRHRRVAARRGLGCHPPRRVRRAGDQ